MIKQCVTRLPFEYQEVEYIENYISEYIDTGLTGADMTGCEIEICMQVLISNANEFMLQGAYESGHAVQIGLVTVDENTVRCSMNLAFVEAVMVSGFSKADFHTLYLTSGLQKVDGTQVGTTQTTSTLTTNQFLIFGRTNGDASNITISKMTRIKYFWVKKNDEYLRYFIPCYRKADNEAGMYDIANDVFYTNIGDGAFIKGPDVNITHWNEVMYRQYGVNETLSPIPTTVFSQGDGIDSCTIYGNTVQNGTPTPTDPVDIIGVGDMSGNLFDKTVSSQIFINTSLALAGWWQFQSGSAGIVIRIPCEKNTTYTLACDVVTSVWRLSLTDITDAPTDTAAVATNDIIREKPQSGVYSFTTTSNTKYILFQVGASVIEQACDIIMLNTGSTPLPYEPYGYVVPIEVDNTKITVPLNTTQSIRRIKKLVLTGDETWTFLTGGKFWTTVTGYMKNGMITVCTHYIGTVNASGSSSFSNGTIGFYNTTNDRLIICNASFNDETTFKQYLQQQYQAGTPVTVYYVLAEPQTVTLNEPLMKIGDYADSVTYSSNIPTTYGQNDITTDTQIKPSKLDITYNALRRAKVYKNNRWILNPSIDWSQTLKISDLQSKKIKEMEGEYIGYNIHT